MDLGNKKIIVAMSGGVDSSVAAALLHEKGYDVVGVTLKLLPRGGQGFGCCGNADDLNLAKRTAEKIGIPHYTMDYSPDFEKHVINYFVDSYVNGETPNPCLACNKKIKFEKLKNFAGSLGASFLATGHYARIVHDNENGENIYRLLEAVDSSKDQSYVLFNADQEKLASTLYPVGDFDKPDIRQIAKKWDLPNHDKKDSQEICFVPGRDYRSFVESRVKEKEEPLPASMKAGPIKNKEGQVVGTHDGVAFYTIGQRSGLHIRETGPFYVTKLNSSTNTLVVGASDECTNVGLEAQDVAWVRGNPPANEFEALIKIRYKHTPVPARIQVTPNGYSAFFQNPERAVSPGQAAVIYQYNEKYKAREVLGGGKISRSLEK